MFSKNIVGFLKSTKKITFLLILRLLVTLFISKIYSINKNEN